MQYFKLGHTSPNVSSTSKIYIMRDVPACISGWFSISYRIK